MDNPQPRRPARHRRKRPPPPERLADLAAVGATAELAAQLHEAGQHIDVLVNNAGAGFHRPFAGEPADEVAAEIRLNCGAVADLTAA